MRAYRRTGRRRRQEAHILTLNTDRRHLSKAEQKALLTRKKSLAAQILAENPKLPDRQVAKRAGLDHKTVAKVRSEGESRGDIPTSKARTDSKGREQTARRPGPTTSQTEKKRRKAAQRLQEDPEASDRQVAKATGLSPTTVGSVRAEGERRVQIGHVEKRTDTKGRKQVAVADYFRAEVEAELPQGRPAKGGKLPPLREKVRDRLGAIAGVSGKTLEKATAVVRAAEKAPKKYGKIAPGGLDWGPGCGTLSTEESRGIERSVSV